MSDQLNGMNDLFQGYNLMISGYPAILNATEQGIPCIVPKDGESSETIEYNGQEYEIPTGVSFVSPGSSVVAIGSTTSGNSESSYSSSMAATVGVSGSYGLFSASLTASYGSDVSIENTSYYATCIDSVEAYTIGFNADDVDIDGSDGDANFEVNTELINAFEALIPDSDGSNAQDFFNIWGTHVIGGILMGGQCNYSMYGSTSDFSDTETFSESAEASYETVSGSESFQGASTTSTKNVESSSSLGVIGGNTTANTTLATTSDPSNEVFQDWVQTIVGNEAWYGFTDQGGLIPIYEFCNIDETKTYLENVYNQLTGVSIVTSSQAVNDQSTMTWEDSLGATSGDYLVNVEEEMGHENTQTWNANADEVLVGIGGKINSDHHLDKMAIVTWNLRDDSYKAYFYGGSSTSSYQAFCLVPKGCVITGFGTTMKNQSFAGLAVQYQTVNLGAQDGIFLDESIQTLIAQKADAQEVDFKNLDFGNAFSAEGIGSSIDELNRCATNPYPVNTGNQKIIDGFSIFSSDSKNPNRGFNYLTTSFTGLDLESNTNSFTPKLRVNKFFKNRAV